jgi:hypothetical protein
MASTCNDDRSQVAFWTEMESAVPNQARLEAIAADFENSVASATRSFDALLAQNSRSVTTLRDYASFTQKVGCR